MRTYLKTILAVTGGVAGVSGGVVGLALRKTSVRSPEGGGDAVLASSSDENTAQEAIGSSTSSESEDSSEAEDSAEVSSIQDTDPVQGNEVTIPATPVKKEEEEKENCEVIDFSHLDDVFYNLVKDDKYILISCASTNKNVNDKFSKKWKGLFPDYLLLNKEQAKKLKLVTETIGSGENIQMIVFSSEQLSSSVTGKWGDISQDPEGTFRVQEIDFREPKTGKIFFFLIENIESLR